MVSLYEGLGAGIGGEENVMGAVGGPGEYSQRPERGLGNTRKDKELRDR